jgi:two-component system chemotaxis sensor kinase CheA
MRSILAPLLRQAGHEVLIGTSGEAPDIILCSGTAAVCGAEDVPVLTLSTMPDAARRADGSIYRYDRDEIMAAIASLGTRSAA